jgi:hypothetical protein
MLWSAGLEAPRHVWVHGWLLAAGGERMSKSRGNFLDPTTSSRRSAAMVRATSCSARCRSTGTPKCRGTRSSVATTRTLQDFGNLLNRTVSMTKRISMASVPRRASSGTRRSRRAGTRRSVVHGRGRVMSAPRSPLWVWEFVEREPRRRRGEALGPREGVEAGDERPAIDCAASWAIYVEACRLIGLAVAPYYAADGTTRAGPARIRVMATGGRERRDDDPGRVGVGCPSQRGGPGTTPEPLFQRLEDGDGRGCDQQPPRRMTPRLGRRPDPAPGSTPIATSMPTVSPTTRKPRSTRPVPAVSSASLVPGWNVASCERARSLA